MLELPISRGYLATKTLSILNDSDDEIERNSVKKKRRRNRMKLKMTSYIKKKKKKTTICSGEVAHNHNIKVHQIKALKTI